MEPLAEERKNKWHREMDWLLSPTKYMVELVPSKQSGANGRTMEVLFMFVGFRLTGQHPFYNVVRFMYFFFEQIMTPKVRADIHINLPALQKLDSMLIVGDLFTLPNNLYIFC